MFRSKTLPLFLVVFLTLATNAFSISTKNSSWKYKSKSLGLLMIADLNEMNSYLYQFGQEALPLTKTSVARQLKRAAMKNGYSKNDLNNYGVIQVVSSHYFKYPSGSYKNITMNFIVKNVLGKKKEKLFSTKYFTSKQKSADQAREIWGFNATKTEKSFEQRLTRRYLTFSKVENLFNLKMSKKALPILAIPYILRSVVDAPFSKKSISEGPTTLKTSGLMKVRRFKKGRDHVFLSEELTGGIEMFPMIWLITNYRGKGQTSL